MSRTDQIRPSFVPSPISGRFTDSVQLHHHAPHPMEIHMFGQKLAKSLGLEMMAPVGDTLRRGTPLCHQRLHVRAGDRDVSCFPSLAEADVTPQNICESSEKGIAMTDQTCLPQKNRSPRGPRTLRAVAAAALLVLGSLITGCGAQGTVEGVFHDQDFSITDFAPKAHFNQKAQMAVVTISEGLMEGDREVLRLVTLKLNGSDDLSVGDVIDVDGDHAEMDVSTGDLERIELANGNTLISSSNNDFASAVSGTITLDSVDDVLAGTFSVDLDDGGYLEGTFAVDRQ